MNRGNNMQKILVSLSASLAVLGLGFAQVPGGIQEAPRPGQTPFPLGQGGMKMGGGSGSVAASGNYVYVLSGNTLYQFSVDGLKLVAKTTLPLSDRGQGGRGQGRPDGVQK